MTIERLAVYGSLAPGEVNHDVVAAISGVWRRGVVRGVLHSQGWGAARGFPGLVWDPEGPAVPVQVLASDGLVGHWNRLDAFEGADYRRALVPVTLDTGETVLAFIYLVR